MLCMMESTLFCKRRSIFLFQAEDGIRDGHVTGVQTCALPIFHRSLNALNNSDALFSAFNDLWMDRWVSVLVQDRFQPHIMVNLASAWGPTDIFNAHSMGYRITSIITRR